MRLAAKRNLEKGKHSMHLLSLPSDVISSNIIRNLVGVSMGEDITMIKLSVLTIKTIAIDRISVVAKTHNS